MSTLETDTIDNLDHFGSLLRTQYASSSDFIDSFKNSAAEGQNPDVDNELNSVDVSFLEYFYNQQTPISWLGGWA